MVCYCRFVLFFFKQKTAYEMRISDWSSDVCSSDLAVASSPGKDVAAVALGVSDAVATPVPPPVPSPESATDEASDGLAPGDMEHDVADSGIADGPLDRKSTRLNSSH